MGGLVAALCQGHDVRFGAQVIETETVVYRSATGTVRANSPKRKPLACS